MVNPHICGFELNCSTKVYWWTIFYRVQIEIQIKLQFQVCTVSFDRKVLLKVRTGTEKSHEPFRTEPSELQSLKLRLHLQRQIGQATLWYGHSNEI